MPDSPHPKIDLRFVKRRHQEPLILKIASSGSRRLGIPSLVRLLSFLAEQLLAVCMSNSRDLGESLAERSRSIGAIFRQAN